MFFIFNKDKVMSYIVTVFTVAILFFTASVFTNNKDTVQTSANEEKDMKVDSCNIIENDVIVKNEIII